MVHSDKLMAKPGSLGLVGREQPQVQQPGERLGLPARGESMSLFSLCFLSPCQVLDPKFPPQVVQDAYRVRCEPGAINAEP